ncbi:MAG TPA: hypothetical protein VE966_00920 [Gemmatimonadales bacterium]|nr:hypothetical protein [Gemmatimonadales bacterium]
MVRVVGRTFLAAAAAMLAIAAACRDAQAPDPQASLLPGLPAVGAIVVSTLTTGSSIDPDGYTVTVDNGPSQHIGSTGVVTFTGLSIGTHTVTLSGVASNCTCITTLSVTIPLAGTGSVTFTVSCAAQPPPAQTGDLTVSTSTTGSNVDPDGYTLTLDGSTTRAIGTNASTTFSALPAGSHTVVLSGVAGNCSVSGGTSRTVNVPAGGTASTSFAVSCTAPPPQTGDLTVSTSTTGSNVDPDGYTLTLDGSTTRAIGTNASTTFSALPAGSHTVVLSGVAGNCSVSGGTSRTVNVPAGGTASTSFAVTCAAVSGDGSLTVNTSTTGSNLDPDGYTVVIDGGAASQQIATNGSVTFTGPAGDHQVALSGVATNCTVSGANPRTVTVPAGGTTTTTFSVSCAGTPPPPAGRVTGQGQVGTAAPQPGNDVVTFNFDVRADLTGRFTGTDYADLHPGGVPATLTTDPVNDPATSFTAFRSSSSVCSDPSRGVEIDGTGREDTGGVVAYTIAVCDNGPANSGMDYFSIFIPSEGFRRQGQVASGDIVKS